MSPILVRTSQAAWMLGRTANEVVRLANDRVLPVHGRDERGARLFLPDDPFDLGKLMQKSDEHWRRRLVEISNRMPDRTYAEIAEMLGVNRFTLRKWLSGLERPQVRFLFAIQGLHDSFDAVPESDA